MGTFLIWWLMLLLLGIFFMPLTVWMFPDFRDGGWLFSKVMGIVVPGFLVWLLTCCHLVKFNGITCVVITLICMLVNTIALRKKIKRGEMIHQLSRDNLRLIIGEEILFFLLFAGWTYLAGFRPEAYGTEKFMDYGFMAAMMKSDSLPAQDIWYSGSTINYYYGGQYFAVFLTKLSNTRIQETYNVCRTMVAAFAFVLPFSLIRQVWEDRTKKHNKPYSKAAVPAGLLAGAAVSLSGNMHFVLANYLSRWTNNFLGHDPDYSYWFPNSTRYIGYYPEGNDKTIHEFPSYSFILGDLHAHVVNLMFVLLVLGLVYSYMKKPISKPIRWRDLIRDRHLWLFGILLGIFHFTNYWDFAIYLVVILAVCVFRAMQESGFTWKGSLLYSVFRLILLYIVSRIAALPFTLSFETMVSGVGIAQNHTSIKQFLVVWGLPFFVCILFLVLVIREALKKAGKADRFKSIFVHTKSEDLFIAGLMLCGIGLVLIPELVYVRDIYEDGYARANTMFKLTYQAYTIFGMCMAYGIIRFLLNKASWLYRIGVVCVICLMTSCTYIVVAGSAWFGDDLSLSAFQGLDAQQFLEEDFPEDAEAIRWLDTHGTQQDVLVEGCGDSYSDYQRVSAMTGVPCIAGWYVHEWLWRNDTDALSGRVQDVEDIYTSTDEKQVRDLLDQYQVTYIYVGTLEREKYGSIQETFLQSLGSVVFSEGETYIIQIDSIEADIIS